MMMWWQISWWSSLEVLCNNYQMAMLAMTRCMLCDAGMCLVCVGLGKLVPCHLVLVPNGPCAWSWCSLAWSCLHLVWRADSWGHWLLFMVLYHCFITLPPNAQLSTPTHGIELVLAKGLKYNWHGEHVCRLLLAIDGIDGDLLSVNIISKWWYFTLMCLACGQILGTVAVLIVPLLF